MNVVFLEQVYNYAASLTGGGPRRLAVILVPQECWWNHTCLVAGPRAQTNAVTSYIDGSVVYGSSEQVAESLRLRRGGLMRTLPVFRELELKDLLPLKIDHPDDGCIRADKDIYCFLAGDNRVNEQVVLSVLHTMLVRQHNQIADRLQHINPHWDDERLYQETRHIVGALLQHVTYSEFLPMLLGKETMKKYGLEPRDEGFADDYDPEVDSTVTAAFITAAFRFGHSLLPGAVERWSATHKYIDSQRLSEVLKRPYGLYKPGWYDQYVLGLVNQVPQAMDDFVTQEFLQLAPARLSGAMGGNPPRPPLFLERCARGWLPVFWESREYRQRESVNSQIICVGELADKKIDGVSEVVDKKIDSVNENVDRKIDSVNENVDRKIEGVSELVNNKVDCVDKKFDNVSERLDSVECKVDQKVSALKKEWQEFLQQQERLHAVAEEEPILVTTETTSAGNEKKVEVATSTAIAGEAPQFCSVGMPQPGVGKGITTKPAPYDGQTPWRKYRDQFEIVVTLNDWTEEQIVHTGVGFRAAIRRPVPAARPPCPTAKPHPATRRITTGAVAGHREAVAPVSGVMLGRGKRSAPHTMQDALKVESARQSSMPRRPVRAVMLDEGEDGSFKRMLKDLQTTMREIITRVRTMETRHPPPKWPNSKSGSSNNNIQGAGAKGPLRECNVFGKLVNTGLEGPWSVTNHLFQQPLQQFGMDLAAINVQRAREHGVPSYNHYRTWCGLPLMERWSNMLHAMPNSTVHRYNDVYDHPEDIDLWSAGVAEQAMSGSLVGPIFNCLIARTFKRLKKGDRFWYENSGWPSSFTAEQLQSIRAVRLSRLLCDSADNVETIQVYAMALPDAQTNPRVSCRSRVLAHLDLTKWREDPLSTEVRLASTCASLRKVGPRWHSGSRARLTLGSLLPQDKIFILTLGEDLMSGFLIIYSFQCREKIKF
ncbi:hypothetical protein PR048_023857 [Dryococelus australis]|uniref:Chorion peroxidase n=1 Tax=Dryococelus australis TaxID=614101 RepID=A0ABQ9GVF5_9NEOP|nr:hypothetical protein PR048_023857 [Dryococelus australis]